MRRRWSIETITAAGYRGNGVPGSVAQDHNREHVSASELVALGAYDFRIRQKGSASVDAGAEIQGINEAYTGVAPDLGAHEFGGFVWNAGSSITPESFGFDE